VRHTLEDLVAQRIFGLACGYPDANDADGLGDDPIQKLLLGRDPIVGERLASQPTISRFENGAASQVLSRMGRELATSVIERHRRRLHLDRDGSEEGRMIDLLIARNARQRESVLITLRLRQQ